MKMEQKRGRVFSSKLSGSSSFAILDGLFLRTSQLSLVDPSGREPYLEVLPKSGMMRNGKLYKRRTWVRHIKGHGFGLWPTPRASAITDGDSTFLKRKAEGKVSTPKLGTAVKMWPTPQAWDSNRGPQSEERYQKHLGGPNLISEIMHQENWPTPTGRDFKDTGDCKNVPVNCLLGRAVEPTKMNGSLDPEFVEYLMGYKKGWTDLNASETR